MLLDHLLDLYQEWSQRSELEIRAVGCLWICSHPCAIALSVPTKPTYFLANVPGADTAEALLQWSEQYLNSQDGSIPWKQFPEVLKTNFVARIPPSPLSKT
jgi:predicted metal-binding protein